jgi:hypothetical protein
MIRQLWHFSQQIITNLLPHLGVNLASVSTRHISLSFPAGLYGQQNISFRHSLDDAIAHIAAYLLYCSSVNHPLENFPY